MRGSWVLVIAILVLGCGGPDDSRYRAAAKDLATAREEAAAADIPLEAADFEPKPPIPSGQNAADDYQKAIVELHKLDEQRREFSIQHSVAGQLGKGHRLSEETLAALKADLAKMAPTMVWVDRALQKPSVYFAHDYSLGVATLFPEFTMLKQCARAKFYGAIVAAREHRANDCLKDLEAGLQIGKAARDNRGIIGLAVYFGFRMLALSAMADCMLESNADHQILQACSSVAKKLEDDEDLTNPIATDAGMKHISIEGLGKPLMGQVLTVKTLIALTSGTASDGDTAELERAKKLPLPLVRDAFDARTLQFYTQWIRVQARETTSANRIRAINAWTKQQVGRGDPPSCAVLATRSSVDFVVWAAARTKATIFGLDVLGKYDLAFPTTLPGDLKDQFGGYVYKKTEAGFEIDAPPEERDLTFTDPRLLIPGLLRNRITSPYTGGLSGILLIYWRCAANSCKILYLCAAWLDPRIRSIESL